MSYILAIHSSSVGPGIGHDSIVSSCILGDSRPAGGLREPNWDQLMAASASFTSLALQLTLRTTLHPTATRDEALLFLDANAQSNLLLLQFVDDAFVLQSTCWGLFRVCRSMSHFAFVWHHRFAGGSKAASVLCVGDTWPEGLPLPVLDGQQVRRAWYPFRQGTHSQWSAVSIGWAAARRSLRPWQSPGG